VQWLINEFKDFKKEVQKKLDSFLESPVLKDNDERLTKLEGEIRALKARMGKKSD
jgi:hypothetical protein